MDFGFVKQSLSNEVGGDNNTHPTKRDIKAVCQMKPIDDHFMKMNFGLFMVTTIKSKMFFGAGRLLHLINYNSTNPTVEWSMTMD